MDITPLDVQYEDVQEGKPPSSGLAPELMVTESSPMTSEARELGRDSPDMATPVVPSEEPVQVFGYLQKQGRRLKGWHPRWFEMRGQHMYYYKNNAKKHCLGEIQLSICTDVHSTNAATFGHPFEILTQERSHILAARTVDDMEKWIDAIKKNKGPRDSDKDKPKKTTKVKKWDSFKNTFTITRHRSASPQPSNPSPTGTNVSRNKSFLDRFKRVRRERSDSPSSTEHRAVEKRNSFPRPLSLRSEDTPSSQLHAALVDPPMAVSVPTTPLAEKRRREKAARHSPSPARQTPAAGPSPQSTPEHGIKDEPKHTSTPDKRSSPGAPVFTKPKPLVKDPKPTPPQRLKKGQQESSSALSQSTSDNGLPEILTQQLAWDSIKEMLEALPEKSEQLFPDILPPEDEPWVEKDTPIEQLREFLAVCA